MPTGATAQLHVEYKIGQPGSDHQSAVFARLFASDACLAWLTLSCACMLAQLVDEAYQRWLTEEEGVVDDITAVVVRFLHDWMHSG